MSARLLLSADGRFYWGYAQRAIAEAHRATAAVQAQAIRKEDGRMRKHWQVRKGQIVRVIDGPMTGFRGEVKEVREQTAKVDFQVYGRASPVDLALGQIELVPGNSN